MRSGIVREILFTCIARKARSRGKAEVPIKMEKDIYAYNRKLDDKGDCVWMIIQKKVSGNSGTRSIIRQFLAAAGKHCLKS